MTGLLTAYLLHQQGIRYVLVEKGRICSGTTGNTTAKITYQHGLIYNKILKSRGIEAAKKYLLANKAAFQMYAELCENADCEYEIKDNFVYSKYNRKKLEDEITALDKIGYKAGFCEDVAIPLKTVGAVRFAGQAQFNPLKFDRVVAATHFPFINKHGSYFLKLYQHRSYVVALENAQKLDGMYVDEDRLGMSFRNSEDLLLLGGGGHRTGKSGGNW